MNLALAEKWARQIAKELEPMCDRIEIAGSIRRRRPEPNDIDLVILPRPGLLGQIQARCKKSATSIKLGGDVNFLFMVGKVQVDVFFASHAVPDLFGGGSPCNFGSMMVCRTGSMEFNTWLACEAQRLGLHWNPYRGIMKGDAVLASEKEKDIFEALSLDFVEPERRER